MKNNMNRIAIFIITVFLVSCSQDKTVKPNKIIHPKVFSMVECWLSDGVYPVVTEINLESTENNNDQFSYNSVFQKNGWITSAPLYEGRGFQRYKILYSKDDEYKILFQHNGGGTLTTQTEIGFVISERSIVVNGNPEDIRILKITSINNL